MDKFIYIKYNTHRAPRFQVRTGIVERDGKKVVYKSPLSDMAKKHIDSLQKKADLIERLYCDIKTLKGRKVNDSVEYDFVSGNSLLSGVDFEQEDMDQLVRDINESIFPIFEYNEKYIELSHAVSAAHPPIFIIGSANHC